MKKRKDSFFGLHMDFHASPEKCDVLGKNLKEDDIREICRTIKPDYIQIDCKGHPGWCSYPSKLGNAMPEFAMDTLALWRKVTIEEDIALYMHYSGVYDIKYCSENPDARVMMADGSFHNGYTRLNCDYIDKLLIPQLLELAEDYKVDGVWIDGECWSCLTDFRPESLLAFEQETGINLDGKLPATREDPYYEEYREYFRELFRRHMRRYIDAVHSKCPDFQIASNWAFSDHMPEKISAPVDFISGDLNPQDSFTSARYAARAIAQHNFPWDLMSWNFRVDSLTPIGTCDKHPIQILQEASAVISLGGGFQNYIMQYADGSPNMNCIREMTKLSEFVRSREKFCFKGNPIHQAAILLSTYDRHHESGNLYSRNGYEKIMGLTSLLCDSGQSTEIVSEHTLENSYESYPMIVVPELHTGLASETTKELLSYAYNGGSLVLVGKNTCNLFADSGAPFKVNNFPEYKNDIKGTDNGHTSTGKFTDFRCYAFTLDGKRSGSLLRPAEIVAPDIDAVAKICSSNNEAVAGIVPYGKGKIAAIGFDIGSQYLVGSQYMQRELIRIVADKLYSPKVRIESVLGLLEIVCLEKDGRLMLQLINANGNHNNPISATEDVIPPVVDACLSIGMDKEPQVLFLQPDNCNIPFKYKDGRVYFKLERIDIHNVVEVIE